MTRFEHATLVPNQVLYQAELHPDINLLKMARPERFELPTLIRSQTLYPAELRAQMERTESNPRPSPWQGDARPLSHVRINGARRDLNPHVKDARF